MQGVQKKDTFILCYNSENMHSIFENGTRLYLQKHGKADSKCYMAYTPPGQSRQLLKVKADALCEPPYGGLAPAAARPAGD